MQRDLVQADVPLLGRDSSNLAMLMEGTTGPEAALRTMEANVFEPACMTSFVGNVCVFQASEQLHCWG